MLLISLTLKSREPRGYPTYVRNVASGCSWAAVSSLRLRAQRKQRQRALLALRGQHADDQQAALADRERRILPEHAEERLQHVIDER